MANDYTSERYWKLDSVEVIIACGTPVTVRKIIYVPTGRNSTATIQGYSPTGVLRTEFALLGNTVNTTSVDQDWGDKGRTINGFKVSAITSGDIIHVYLGRR